MQASNDASTCIANVANNTATLEIRIGYFGSCILLDGRGSFLPPLVCSKNFQTLADVVHGTKADPLDLLHAAKHFHDGTIFSGLVFISIIMSSVSFFLLATFPGWHEEVDSVGSDREVKSFPSRSISILALACVTVASVFSVISALWQHLSAAATVSMVKAFGHGYARGHVGTTAMVFGWGGMALLSLTMMGLLLMIISIRVLADLATEESLTSVTNR